MNLGGLNLRLVMTDSVRGVPPGREEITNEQVDVILSAYRRLTSPLSVLAQTDADLAVGCDGGTAELHSFRAQVTWPGKWSEEYFEKVTGKKRWQRDKDYLMDRDQELREEAEGLVMGERYNEAYVSGRAPPCKSVWEDRFGGKL